MNRRLHKALALASTLPYRLRLTQPELRYHFIHIPKNGGSAVRAAMKWRGDVFLSEPRHYRYIDIASEENRHLKFFAIVRNPWSRTASRYRFVRKQCLKWPSNDERRRYIQSVSFEQFVKDRKIMEIPAHPGQPWMGPLNSWFNQLDWVRGHDGEVACDCLRFEFLNRDINDYFGSFMLLPREKASKQPYDYRAMYTDETAEIVGDFFREDIEHFGFGFDGPATRGTYD